MDGASHKVAAVDLQSQIARAPAPAASPPAPPLLDLLSLEDEPAAPAPTAAASASTGAWATFGDEVSGEDSEIFSERNTTQVSELTWL